MCRVREKRASVEKGQYIYLYLPINSFISSDEFPITESNASSFLLKGTSLVSIKAAKSWSVLRSRANSLRSLWTVGRAFSLAAVSYKRDAYLPGSSCFNLHGILASVAASAAAAAKVLGPYHYCCSSKIKCVSEWFIKVIASIVSS